MLLIQLRILELLMMLGLLAEVTSFEIILVFPDSPGVNAKSDNKIINKPYLLETFQAVKPFAEFHDCKFSEIIECLSTNPNASILLDLSSNLDVQLFLSQVAKDYMLIHLVYDDNMKFKNKWTYSFTPTKSSEMSAFFALLSHFNWTEGIVFGNGLYYDLKNEISQFSSALKYIPIGSDSNIEELVNKIVFKLGATLYYILADQITLQDSLKNADLLSAGTGIILDQKSGYDCLTDGALIIVAAGHEFDSSLTEYLAKSVIDVISYLLDNASSESTSELALMLDYHLLHHSHKNEFSIVNIQNSKRTIVGSIINNVVTITKNPIFPGKTHNVPKSTKKELKLSINDGTTNPGLAPNQGSKSRSVGSYVAIDKINESPTILPDFKLSLFSFDCGVTIFNESFAKSCFIKNSNDLGLAHLTAFDSAIANRNSKFIPKNKHKYSLHWKHKYGSSFAVFSCISNLRKSDCLIYFWPAYVTN